MQNEAVVAKILLLQGANLTFLGRREPAIYSSTTPAELDPMPQRHAQDHGYQLEIFCTNIEGDAINRIYRAVDEGFDGLVMNPAGFTYAGFAFEGLHKGGSAAICGGAHQQYCEAQHPLRPLRCGGGDDHWKS
jgi:3-dehydroquinate dehydratase